MSAIRPLERSDLDELAHTYVEVVLQGRKATPVRVAEYLERLIFDQPWFDEEIPSLVFEQPGRGIVGFIGSYPRRLRMGDRAIRLACSGQLFAHPDVRHLGVGALLMRRYLKGPQDITVTDGANLEAKQLWVGLGGSVNALASSRWTKVLAPAAYGAALAARRRHKKPGEALRRATSAADSLFRRAKRVDTASRPLTPMEMVDGLASLAKDFPLRPDYSREELEWLFAELANTGQRGEFVAKSVIGADGEVLGWYLAFMKRGDISEVIQLAANAKNAGAVLDDLIIEADRRGAAAIQGRLEPHIYSEIWTRRCFVWRSEWALIDSRNAEVMAATLSGKGLLTRLEGEWWMVPHETG